MKIPSSLIVLAILFLFVLSLGCSQPASSSTPSTEIGNKSLTPIPISGQMTITRPGLYYLTSDLSPSEIEGGVSDSSSSLYIITSSRYSTTRPYITISSSDVIFDGMGHTIDGKKVAQKYDHVYGISITRSSYNPSLHSIIVRNITLSNWSVGLFFDRVKDFELVDSQFYKNDQGFTSHASSNISISGNVFSKNNGEGMNGVDLENVWIFDNTILQNKGNGIFLEGWQEVPITFKLFEKWYPLSYFSKIQKTTSAGGYTITRNTISDNSEGIGLSNTENCVLSQNAISNSKRSGINIRRVANTIISDNSIQVSGNDGITIVNPGINLVVVNNTGTVKYSSYPEKLPVSVILGIILIILFKVLAGSSNIVKKFLPTKIINKILTQFGQLEVLIRTAIRNSRLSILFEGPLAVTIAGAAIFGGAYAFIGSIHLTLVTFSSLLIISGIVTVTPRAVQYLTATKWGLESDYRLWWGGILIILVTMLLPVGEIFGQPVKMQILTEASRVEREILIAKLAAPFTTIFLSVGFLLLYLLKGTVAPFAMIGLNMSLLSSVVLLLPISPMDGEYICKYDRLKWGLLFFPVLIGYMYLLTMM
jgi:parallel beta-helix repeat protein